MRPLQISAETAVTLSKKLGVPIEHLMHMPQHILMQKLAELAKEESTPSTEENSTTNTDKDKDKSV
ncbi:YycC family protein [Paenibacillus sp. Marseille-Q4541]|uniref:YycC family protein n=1 Tax=Paenibacillus sp. Marseille-Q4541 TaxID=2831522 RepID=UPI001BAC2D93|nr:YycC family protein [Paenibacillus sp. Marseille-Q4541]